MQTKEKSGSKKTFKFSVLRSIFFFVRPYKSKFYYSLLLSVLLAVLSPVRPWLIQAVIVKGLGKSPEFFWLKGAAAVVIGVTMIQIALIVIESVCRFIFSFITASLGQHVIKDMRVVVYEKIVRLNLSQFDKTPIGTLTTRTISDVESVNDIFSDGIIPIIADLLSILAVLVYMFSVDWSLTLVCLTPFPILIIATYYFKESVNRSFVRVRNAVAALNAFVQEHITGMSVVQAFAAENLETNKFKKINREHRDANVRSIMAYSIFFPLVELVLALSLGLLVWWAGGKQQPDAAGKITSFILCLNLLFRPLRMIADKFNLLQMGMIAGERIFKVLENDDFVRNEGTFAPSQIKGELIFQDVWFAYIADQYVLKGVSLHIPAGKVTAIVGSTGSGKTSIVSLINRLYPVNKGKVLLDNEPIEQYELGFLRSKIAVVLQDVFLFSGSVYENITLRNPAVTREMVYEAAQAIGIHDFIMSLPGGYDFNVMERGVTLSLGQRQLISFVRALLYNPAVLILDEATSSVDTESEQLIQHAIDKLIVGRTSIVIAHRLSTIRKAHQIVVIENGVIAETGPHEELIARKGLYQNLHAMQFEQGD